MRAIIGLGNPGKEYAHTRHNIGFFVVDTLAHAHHATFTSKRSLEAEITEIMIDGERVLLINPQTFMNASGRTLTTLFTKYPLKPDDLLVIYDDADLPFAEVRFKKSGGSAGHRGMESLLEVLPKGTSLARVRVGIGRPHHPDIPLDEFVLGRWSQTEEQQFDEILQQITHHVDTWLTNA